jgi:lysophospholipase L1-like esterase
MVLLGTNDWGWAMKLYPEDGEQSDISVFSVAYAEMLRKLKRTYPRVELWCLTLPINGGAGQGDSPCGRVVSRDVRDYSSVIADCARNEGCRVVELTAPREPYSTLDGFHPDRGGMAAIADAVLEQIKGQKI